MLIEFIPTFNYFKNFVTATETTKILDFGSNCGNYLKSSPISLDYTGVDVDLDSIKEGERLFPKAKWVWYDRYNPVYNKLGKKVLPRLDQKFDLIISYSVFTHMTLEDTDELLDFLYEKLNPGGKICFSFCDIDNRLCVEWFRARRINCDLIFAEDYIYLVDNKISKTSNNESCIHFVAFYKRWWLLDHLQRFSPKAYNVPNGWLQDCIVIEK